MQFMAGISFLYCSANTGLEKMKLAASFYLFLSYALSLIFVFH